MTAPLTLGDLEDAIAEAKKEGATRETPLLLDGQYEGKYDDVLSARILEMGEERYFYITAWTD